MQGPGKERTGKNGTVSSFGKAEAAGAVSPSYGLQPRPIIPQTFSASLLASPTPDDQGLDLLHLICGTLRPLFSAETQTTENGLRF